MKICPLCSKCFADEILACSEENHPSLITDRKGDCEIIDGFRLEFFKEASAISEVYLATRTTLKESCLVKIFKPNIFERKENLRENFLRETQDLLAVNHQNLASVLERGILPDGSAYLITEHFAEKTLREHLKEKDLNEFTALGIARQIAEGLNELHKAGILHRNIRPENIILTGDEENKLLVKIINIDFGGIQSSQEQKNIDELKYFSPEQCNGKIIDCQTDIYALGILLFEMLTGKSPFEAEDSETLIHKQIKENPPAIQIHNFNIRALLNHTLKDSLQKRKRLRLKNANIFARRLRYIEQIGNSSSISSHSYIGKQFNTENTYHLEKRILPEEILANLPTEELPPIESIIGEILTSNETEIENSAENINLDFNSSNPPHLIDWEQPDDIPPMPEILERGAESFISDFTIEPVFINHKDSVIETDSKSGSAVFSLEISKPIKIEGSSFNKYPAKAKHSINFPIRRKTLAIAAVSILFAISVGGIWLNRSLKAVNEIQTVTQNSSVRREIVSNSDSEINIENKKAIIEKYDINSPSVTFNSETTDLANHQIYEIKQKNISPKLTLPNPKRILKTKPDDCDCNNSVQNKVSLNEDKSPKKVEVIVVGSKSVRDNKEQNSSEANIFNRPRIIRKAEYGKSF